MNRTNILHVEDDSNDTLLFQHACRKAGLSVALRSVDDGDVAMAYLNGSEKYFDRDQFPLPDLVLLDLKLPRINGFELLGWIRQEPRFRRLPVVILTSSNQDSDVRRAYDIGANSYLVKPVGFDALVDLAKSFHSYWLTLNLQPQV
jgi:CheY-like chemotaxis protein